MEVKYNAWQGWSEDVLCETCMCVIVCMSSCVCPQFVRMSTGAKERNKDTTQQRGQRRPRANQVKSTNEFLIFVVRWHYLYNNICYKTPRFQSNLFTRDGRLIINHTFTITTEGAWSVLKIARIELNRGEMKRFMFPGVRCPAATARDT